MKLVDPRIAGCGLGLLAVLLIGGSARGQDTGDCEADGIFWYFSPAPHVNLFVHEVGMGEPVVVLHGGPGADHSYMHGLANGLTDDFRFVFYDQRGSLRSRDTDVTHTIADHVADLEALRIALGLPKLNLLAHSAGTTLAYHYLAAHPDRVANLVLVGAVHPVNGDPGAAIFDDEDRALYASRAALFEEFHERPAVREEIRRAGLESPKSARDSARLAVLRQFAADVYHVEKWVHHVPLRVNPMAARETQESIDWDYDRMPLLAAHSDPVTVINGEFDFVVGLRGSPIWKKLARLYMPNVRIMDIPDAGHDAWIDAPDEFAKALKQALGPAR
jgi:pimeloyl-ACP methyl ester carboxylesterase